MFCIHISLKFFSYTKYIYIFKINISLSKRNIIYEYCCLLLFLLAYFNFHLIFLDLLWNVKRSFFNSSFQFNKHPSFSTSVVLIWIWNMFPSSYIHIIIESVDFFWNIFFMCVSQIYNKTVFLKPLLNKC